MSLHQPWASLVAYGLKKIETRGPRSPFRYRGPLLIHAAKKWDDHASETLLRLAYEFPTIDAAFRDPDGIGMVTPPLGAIVAVCRVVDIREMTPAWIAEQTALELAVGDWRPGRFGWVLEDVRRIDPPIPMKGRQGLFRVDEARDLSVADIHRLILAGAVRYA